MQNNKITVALLLGGTSTEKDVSKNTAKSVLIALRSLGYNVVVINPGYGNNQPEDENKFFEEEEYAELSTRNYLSAIDSNLLDNVDVAFIAMHGKWGEDGTLQSLLEMRGIKYTGSGILTSAIAIDKAMTKVIFDHYGVKTPRWFIVNQNHNDYELVKHKIKSFFGYPCVIKPNDQGSTVGLTICKNDEAVEEAVKLSLQFSNKALIEEYIPGREFTVGVLEDQALPVLEIKVKSGFYDYENKYTSGKTDYIVPAELPAEVALHMQHQALLAFKSIGCKCYSRIDFRLTDDNIAYCLEVNNLPGMTSTSLLPKQAKAVGISFEELLDKIIKNALL